MRTETDSPTPSEASAPASLAPSLRASARTVLDDLLELFGAVGESGFGAGERSSVRVVFAAEGRTYDTGHPTRPADATMARRAAPHRGIDIHYGGDDADAADLRPSKTQLKHAVAGSADAGPGAVGTAGRAARGRRHARRAARRHHRAAAHEVARGQAAPAAVRGQADAQCRRGRAARSGGRGDAGQRARRRWRCTRPNAGAPSWSPTTTP